MRLIIILALLTVDDRLMLSVDMFFILNNPFFFSLPSPARVVVVRAVSASDTSLLMADGLDTANGAEGGLSASCRGVARGVDAREILDVEADGGIDILVLAPVDPAGELTREAGGVDRLLSLPPPRAFLKRPLKPFFSGSGAGETVLDRGDGREAGAGVLVALAIGPVCRGVTVRLVDAGLACLAGVAGAAAVLGLSRSKDPDDRSARFIGGGASSEGAR